MREVKAGTRFEILEITRAGALADAVRELFLEYGESLGFNTCFGGFDQELATLPGDYAPRVLFTQRSASPPAPRTTTTAVSAAIASRSTCCLLETTEQPRRGKRLAST